MRGMYWKPEGASQVQRALVAALAITGLVAVERFPSEEQQPYYAEKTLAARTAKEAMDVIRDASEKRGLPYLAKTDPSGSRLIGKVLSPITSGSGSLVSKQTTVNPNFAAVVVQWLKDLGIKSGDVVAVGLSGSFPAMNIAVYSAMHQLGVEPIIISSTAASQWGANNPGFTWLDMESLLRKHEVFPYKSVAASLGGVGDEAIGLTGRGHKLLIRAIERNEIPGIGAVQPETNSPAWRRMRKKSLPSSLPSIRTGSVSVCASTTRTLGIVRFEPTSTSAAAPFRWAPKSASGSFRRASIVVRPKGSTKCRLRCLGHFSSPGSLRSTRPA